MRLAAAVAAACIGSRSPPNAATMSWSRLSTTSSAKVTPVASAMARTSSWTGLPWMTPQVARGSPIRAASCSTRTVSRAARPGATSLGPPEKPAKKCGSTKPVVMRTSASAHSRFSHTGTSLPYVPIQVSCPASRASWLTIRTVSTTSSPNIARSSASLLPRWVPVATRMTTSSRRTMPSSSSRTAGIIRWRGWGRVPSQAEIATVCPGRTRSRRGGPATGSRRAARSTADWSAAAWWWTGSTTVAALGSTSMSSPDRP